MHRVVQKSARYISGASGGVVGGDGGYCCRGGACRVCGGCGACVLFAVGSVVLVVMATVMVTGGGDIVGIVLSAAVVVALVVAEIVTQIGVVLYDEKPAHRI